MKLAVDTSVVLSILKGELDGADWLELLIDHRQAGDRLVICPVVYSELSPFMNSMAEMDKTLTRFGISFDEITRPSAWIAGEVFSLYRKNGGPRTHLIPDFMVAAHAKGQCEGLVANDRGYLRTYFADLAVLSPFK